MEEVESLVRTSLEEIEKALSARTVVGEPMTIEGVTIIPLLSVGFGFGTGGGSGKSEEKRKGEGTGGGTGGAAWVRPIAIIIIDKEGVRIESIKGGLTSAIEKIGTIVPEMIERWMERRREGQS